MGNAIVTGAGQGIGRAIAHRLAADGLDVIALDRDGDAAAAVAAEVGGRSIVVDVTDATAVTSLAGGLDEVSVLVNNAGVYPGGPLLEVNADRFRHVMDVNVFAPLLLAQSLLEQLEAVGGTIVNISSMAGQIPTPGTGVYPTSKAALDALTRGLALELAPRGIRVNAVAPGAVVTEGTAAVSADPAREARTNELLPLGRRGQPADIADAVAFFASDAARYCTGQVLTVDGGLTQATIALLKAAQSHSAH